MNARQQQQLFSNTAEAMQGVTEFIMRRQIGHFYRADSGLWARGAAKLGLDISDIEKEVGEQS